MSNVEVYFYKVQSFDCDIYRSLLHCVLAFILSPHRVTKPKPIISNSRGLKIHDTVLSLERNQCQCYRQRDF